MPAFPLAPVLAFLEIDGVLRHASRAELLSAAAGFGDLDAQNIAPILCSGGTRCELVYLTHALDIWHPVVVEDGSAVFIPRSYFEARVPSARVGTLWETLEFGRTRRGVIDTIERISLQTGIEVALLSRGQVEPEGFGVTRGAIRRAAKRIYGEVIQAPGATQFALARLLRALRDAQLRCTVRGRDIYVVPESGGAAAVAALRRLYERQHAGVVGVSVIDAEASAISAGACEMAAGIGRLPLGAIATLIARVATQARQWYGSAPCPASHPVH